jgi:hypothetical protein
MVVNSSQKTTGFKNAYLNSYKNEQKMQMKPRFVVAELELLSKNYKSSWCL